MGHLTRSANWQRKEQAEYQRHQDWLFEQRYTAARERARSILGKEAYNALIDEIYAAHQEAPTNLQVCEELEKIEEQQ